MNKKYLSMNDASKLCSYDQEYLSLLARQGKLRGEKIAGKWYTTIDWLNEYLIEMRPNMVIGNGSVIRRSKTSRPRRWLYFALVSANAAIIMLVFYMLYVNFDRWQSNKPDSLSNDSTRIEMGRVMGVSDDATKSEK